MKAESSISSIVTWHQKNSRTRINMDGYTIRVANNENDLNRIFPVIKALRKNLSYPDYLNLYDKAHLTDSYELAILEDGNEILAAIGYRILYDFVHGKHIYIDDLITIESQRSKGLGAKLLSYAEEIAKQQRCRGLRLCTGIENERGKLFYDKNGWQPRAIAYKKILNYS